MLKHPIKFADLVDLAGTRLEEIAEKTGEDYVKNFDVSLILTGDIPITFSVSSKEEVFGLLELLSPLVFTLFGFIAVFSGKFALNPFVVFSPIAGPGLVAAIITRSFGVLLRYIGISILIGFGTTMLIKDDTTQFVLLFILLTLYPMWKIYRYAYGIKATKFPTVFASATVLSLIVLITGFVGRKSESVATTTPPVSLAVVNVRTANIRSQASTDAPIVGSAKLADTLKVLSYSNGWYFVEHENLKGYVNEKLVKQIGAVTNK
jgi:hypothetical protein